MNVNIAFKEIFDKLIKYTKLFLKRYSIFILNDSTNLFLKLILLLVITSGASPFGLADETIQNVPLHGSSSFFSNVYHSLNNNFQKFKETYQLDSEELTVIQTQIEVVDWLQSINAQFTNELYACFLASQKGPLDINENKLPFVHEGILNINGIFKTSSIHCSKALTKYISKRLPEDLKELRINLALSSVESDSTQGQSVQYAYRFFNLQLRNEEMFRIHIKHLIKAIGVDDRVAQLAPLDQEEKNEVIQHLEEAKEEICLSYLEKIDNDKISIQIDEKIPLCHSLFKLLSNGNLPKDKITDFYKFAGKSILKFREKRIKKYFQVLNENPFILLFNNANPSFDEIKSALHYIRDQSKKNIDIPKPQSAKWFVQNQWALVYTTTVLSHRYPDRNFNPAIDRLILKGNQSQLISSTATMAAAISSSMVCNMISLNAPLKILSYGISRSACFLGYGTILDMGFMIDSFIQQYIDRDQFIAAFTAHRTPIKAEDLASFQDEATIAIVTTLLGSGWAALSHLKKNKY